MIICSTYRASVVATATNYAAKFSGSNRLETPSTEQLQAQDVNFEIDGYFYFDDVAAHALVAKEASSSIREYRLSLETTSPRRIRFILFSQSGAVVGSVYCADTIVAGQWYHVRAFRVKSGPTNTINLQINDGAIASANVTGAVGATTARFSVGWFNNGSDLYLRGRADNIKIKRDSVIVAQYDFQNAANLGLDSVGSNHLTNINSVTQIEVTN